MAAHHVRPDLLDDPFLGPGELVRECVVAGIEGCPYLGHRDSGLRAGADIFLLQQGKLQEEELFPFEAVTGLGKGLGIGGEMDVPDRESQGHQSLLAKDVLGQGLLDVPNRQVNRLRHQLVHHLAGHSPVPQLVGRVVDPGKDAGEVLYALRRRVVYLRMDHVELTAIDARLSEEEE